MIKFYEKKEICLIAIFLLMITIGLFMYEYILFLSSDYAGEGDALHVNRMVVYGSAIISFLGMINWVGKKSLLSGFIFTVLIISFFSSLRTLTYYAGSGKVEERWAVFPVFAEKIEDVDNQDICYEIFPFSLNIKQLKSGRSFAYARGIWPSEFSTEDIEDVFHPVGPCAQQHGTSMRYITMPMAKL